MDDRGDRILVAYDSRLGSTGEVAAFIGEVLSEGGASVEVKSLAQVDDLKPYDRVVLGSAIRYDRWLPQAIAFFREHQQALRKMPVAVFFTCLVLAQETPEAERKALGYAEQIRQLLPEIQAVDVGRFAGVLEFARLPWLPRLGLRILSAFNGVQGGDYRDWQAIRAWSQSF